MGRAVCAPPELQCPHAQLVHVEELPAGHGALQADRDQYCIVCYLANVSQPLLHMQSAETTLSAVSLIEEDPSCDTTHGVMYFVYFCMLRVLSVIWPM